MNQCRGCDTKTEECYGGFCPKCYKCEHNTMAYFDWFGVMHHLEARYEGIKDRLWSGYMCELHITNGGFIWVDLKGEGCSVDIQLDLARVAVAIRLKGDEEGAMFETSW